MTLEAALDLGLHFRILRQAAGIELIAGIPGEFTMLRALFRKKWKRDLGDGKVNQLGRGTERHRLPAVRAARSRHGHEGLAALAVSRALHLRRATRLEVDALGPVGRCIGVGRYQLTGRAIQDVKESVFRRLHEHRALRSTDVEIGEDHRRAGIEIPLIPRSGLVMPDVFPGIGLQGHDRGEKQRIAAHLAAVPFSVAHADVDEVQCRVVDNRVPHRAAAAEFPPLSAPSFCRLLQCGALEWLGRSAGHGIKPPRLLAGGGIVGRDITAHAHLSAAVADQHQILHHARRARDGVAAADGNGFDFPCRLAGCGVESDQSAVQRPYVDPALPCCDATVHHITTGIDRRRTRDFRIVGPQGSAGLRVEREHLAPSAGHVHDPVDHQRRRLLAAMGGVEIIEPGKPQLSHVAGIDLPQRTEVLLIVSAPRAHPIARLVVRREQASRVNGSRRPCRRARSRRIGRAGGRRRLAASRERKSDCRPGGDRTSHVL